MPDQRRRSLAPGSVRTRVTALAAVLVFVVLVLASGALVITQYQLRLRAIDDSLDIRADDLEALVESGGLVSTTLPFAPDTVAQVVRNGDVLAASHPSVSRAPLVGPHEGDEAFITVDRLAVDDDVFRVLSRQLPGGLELHVARSVDDALESRRILIAALAVTIPLLTLVLAVGVWYLVGRTLRPVEAIRSEVAGMSGEETHRRVPVPPGRDEISRLARTMNEMLARVEESQNRQRRFAADASHELRSPLTRIRSELEVDLAHPQGADPHATHRSVLEETAILQRTVDDLLLLARDDEETVPRRALVDLDDIVLREAALLRDHDGLTLDVRSVTAAQVVGDELRLSRAIRNLFDNAARHAASLVTVTLAEVGDDTVLAVSDDGPGVPAADRERIFERFTRLDPARSRHDGGSGLGLPISRGVVERHGGTLVVDPDYEDGARFVMRIPRPPS